MKESHLELRACTPQPLNLNGFNLKAEIPYGCTIKHISKGMNDFLDFLGFVDLQLHSKKIQRMESFLMPANFSSMVGEFIPSFSSTHSPRSQAPPHPSFPSSAWERTSAKLRFVNPQPQSVTASISPARPA
jgi:hypothetical protein